MTAHGAQGIPHDIVTLARTFVEVFNAQQSDTGWLDKALGSLAEDCEFIDVPAGWVSTGSAGYKESTLFFAEGFPNGRIEITNLVATEDQAVVEFVGRGTNMGPLHLTTGDLPATGRTVELQFCEALRFREGKIVSAHIYFDTMTLWRQLGLVPAMG